MPRPDKRFIRYPRRERSPEPEAHESAAGEDASPHIQVKGRHMVVPRPTTPLPPLAETSEAPSVMRRPLPGEGLTKYDRRSGIAAAAETEHIDEHLDEAVAATSAEPELEATEVVFDLRDSEHGFEGTYWKQPAERPADDTA